MSSPVFLRPTSLAISAACNRTPSPSRRSLAPPSCSRPVSVESPCILRPRTPRPTSTRKNQAAFSFTSTTAVASSRSVGSKFSRQPEGAKGGGTILGTHSSSIAPILPQTLSFACAYSTERQSEAPWSLSSRDGDGHCNILLDYMSPQNIKDLERYSAYTPNSLSLSHFLTNSQPQHCLEVKHSFIYLRREILVRLANIMMELGWLPPDLLTAPICRGIIRQYVQSFTELLVFENRECNAETFAEFNDLLSSIRNRHKDTVQHMAEAVQDLNDAGRLTVHQDDRKNMGIQYFLDRLYTSRISVHMLIAHHKAMFSSEEGNDATVSHKGGHKGVIDSNCDVVKIAEAAYTNAAFISDGMYMDSPKLKLDFKDVTNPASTGITFVYVPSHLYLMLFEIFKNSMRATMELHQGEAIPEVEVSITKTERDISIKISDHGGGFPQKVADNVFLYLYTSAARVDSWPRDLGRDATSPMHGLGYGLPISRLYARYFGGDIKQQSCDGLGTDTYIYLKTLETDAKENLPIYNTSSRTKIRNTKNLASDWTK